MEVCVEIAKEEVDKCRRQILIFPHPVYAWMGWISVLNPSENTFEALKPYIQEAYEYAKERFAKRT